jgi:ABC-type transport system involved in multi-copper enzyme maturation permease subunit
VNVWHRMMAVAWSTLMESLRQKALWVLLLFALVLLGSSIYFTEFTFEKEFKFMKDVGSAAISLLGLLTALIGAAQLIPAEIERRTIYVTLSKPVRRLEFLLGKYLGLLALITLMVFGMTVIFFGVLLFQEQVFIAEVVGSTPASQWSEAQIAAVEQIRDQARDPAMLQAILLLWARLALVEAIALFFSTIATSNIFIIFASVVVYIIGHLQATAREVWMEGSTDNFLLETLLALVALLVPNFQSFSIIDEILAGESVSLSYTADIFGYSVVYTIIILVVSALVFQDREL